MLRPLIYLRFTSRAAHSKRASFGLQTPGMSSITHTVHPLAFISCCSACRGVCGKLRHLSLYIFLPSAIADSCCAPSPPPPPFPFLPTAPFRYVAFGGIPKDILGCEKLYHLFLPMSPPHELRKVKLAVHPSLLCISWRSR